MNLKTTIIVLCALLFAGAAQAQDYRSSGGALVAGVVGYPSHAESPARVTTSSTTARTATAVTPYTYVRIYCTAETSFKFGDSGVTAATTDPYIPSGTPEVFNMGAATHIAFILGAGTAACDVTVLR